MQLSGAILEYFVPAVQRILEIPNRVIVSCIGKSGHIARKIAPTLAFTGTPWLSRHGDEIRYLPLDFELRRKPQTQRSD